MDLRVLGPLEVRVAGGTVSLGTPKQQTVLALLAINAGQVVGMDELIDELWPEGPPVSAVENARSYAANLRRLFESMDPGREWIVRRSTGYVLAVSQDELDLLAFRAECDRGRAALTRQDLLLAADVLSTALARWRGRMLTGVPRGPALTARCTALEEERLTLAEDLAEIDLLLDRPEDAAVALREHVHRHPLRERGHALLIRAVYQLGDVAGALAAYATARTALVDALGVEPGPELRLIQAAVLNRDLEAGPPAVIRGTSPPSIRSGLTPRELPPDIGCFVGRLQEIRQLRRVLRPGSDGQIRRRPALSILYGPGGVGKSALAVHLAHQMVEDFPDGQIYLDLFGSTPGLRPLTPVEAIGRCLRSLGTPRDEIPTGESAAATRFRTAVAGRRLLLVLDNATDAGQVASLIPGSNTCGVIVTAREPLGSIDADCRLRVSALSVDDGIVLLGRLAEGLAADRSTAEMIAELCDGLPLAIRIAAGRLTGRPDLSPKDLAVRLADRRRRLDELELDGLGVRSSIRVGYESLTSDGRQVAQLAARIFRLLGLLSVPDVGPDVVAAMVGSVDADRAEAALDRLVAAGLLAVAGSGRYRLHDLVRLVAAELVVEEDDASSRDRSLHRALSYYLVCLTRAEDLMRPARVSHVRDPLLDVDEITVKMSSPADAQAWVTTELPNVVSAAELASTLPGTARRFTLWFVHWTSIILFNRLELETARRLSRLVLDTADHHQDKEMEGWAHLLLGRCEAEFGSYSAARQHLDRARPLLIETSLFGTALVLNALGGVAQLANEQTEALTRYKECLRFAHEHDIVSMEATAHFNIGNVYAEVERWADAQRHLEESLEMRRRLNDRFGIGASLSILAVIYCQKGELKNALNFVEDGIRYTREIGDRLRECQCLLIATEILLRDGRHDDCLARAEELVSTARTYRHRYAEAAGLRQMAKAQDAIGQSHRAAEFRAKAQQQFSLLVGYVDPVLEDCLSDGVPRASGQ